MKVVGFTFIRNAVTLQYPIVEAIQSILPLCDSVIVGVGNSNDNTLDLIKSIDSDKIIIHETVWDDSLREGGRVLAQETDKSYKLIPDDVDWTIYIQGDEVLHDAYYNNLREAMHRYKDDKRVDGLLLKYRHFYGSYDYVGNSYKWYPYEIRVLRKRDDIYSYKDAQGFRKSPNQKLNVKKVDAYMHHYGWVKPPDVMQQKRLSWTRMYYTDEYIEKHVAKSDEFDYSQIDSLARYEGKHPQVMGEYIKKHNWKFDYDLSKNSLKLKDKLKWVVEKLTGVKLAGPGNYKVIR